MKKGILPSRDVTRRDLLRLLGMGAGGSLISSPLMMIVDSIFKSNILRSAAHAQGLPSKPRKYVFVQMAGAPSRWVYDLFLTPYQTDLTPISVLGTRYTGSTTYTGVGYSTISKNGINVPPMWGFSVPAPGGGTRPMSNLLSNLLHIRGIDSNLSSHDASRASQFKALAASASVTALTADYSDAPLKALNVGCSNWVFTSRNNRGYVALPRVESQNLLQTLLSPFVSKASSDFVGKAQTISSAINNAVANLNTFALNRHPASMQTIQAQADANRMLEGNFGDLAQQWTALVDKYENLIKRSLSKIEVFPGFTDKPVGATSGRGIGYSYNTRAVTIADLKNMIQPTTTIGFLAEHFAVAEYVLVNNISESISISPGGLVNLNSGSATFGQVFDEHFCGFMPTLLTNFYFYRAFSACLLEFVERLKAQGIFDDTIINVSGEFNRSPIHNGSGSNHGHSSVAIYSGLVNGPILLGNIAKDTPSSPYPGTWGYGTSVKLANSDTLFQNGSVLNAGNINATIAALLGVPPAIQAFLPVVAVNSSGIVPLIERARQT